MSDYDYGYSYDDYNDIYTDSSSDNADISTGIALNQNFWDLIGIDPSTISYKETSPTNEEIEKTLGITSSPLDFIKAVMSGKSSLGSAGSVAGMLGVAALANRMFGGGGGGYAGYQGSIPTYTASRTMNTIPTTMTVPTEGGGTKVVPRRPGSGGVTYFSPMVYTPQSTVTGGAGNDTVRGGGGNTVTNAKGGAIRYAEGGETFDSPEPVFQEPAYFGNVFNEKGPEDYGIGSLLNQDNFNNVNNPVLSASQYDIYGNFIPPDPYLRTLTESETNQFERDAARSYYENPENVQLTNNIIKNLEDAVIVRGGMGEVDVQETLRNIYNNPDTKPIFNEYIDQLKYAPSDAAELLEKQDELVNREYEGFSQDDMYVPKVGYDLDRINMLQPNIGRTLIGDIYKLIDPDAPRTFYKNYESGEGYPMIGPGGGGASGGIASLRNGHLGSYSDGGQLLRGPGDGVSDDIPATIADKQPARLANNEFVIPARIVSEIGNGSTEAGAAKLYEMMRRVQKRREKTVGKNKVAVDSKAYKELDKL